MFKIIRKVARAPLVYIADLRKITLKQYLLLHTNFSPSYPIMIFFSLLTTLSLAASIIYDLFTIPQGDNCYSNVRNGAYVMSFLYPLQTILFFICATGSIALSKSSCWKMSWILLFGPLLCGFGFGQLAFIQMCLMSTYNPNTFSVISVFINEAFIDSMIYLYLSFLILYFLLVPCFQFLYSRQKKDQDLRQSERESRKSKSSKKGKADKKQEDKEEDIDLQEQTSCCNRFVCIIYYFMLILFAIAFCFIVLVKLAGPILFTYIWIIMASNSDNYRLTNQKVFLALSLVAYFGPLGLTILILGIQRVVRLGRKKIVLQNQDEAQEKKTIELSQRDNYRQKDEQIFGQKLTAPKGTRQTNSGHFDEPSQHPSESKRASLMDKQQSIRKTLI